jgi:hypothetical protein
VHVATISDPFHSPGEDLTTDEAVDAHGIATSRFTDVAVHPGPRTSGVGPPSIRMVMWCTQSHVVHTE